VTEPFEPRGRPRGGGARLVGRAGFLGLVGAGVAGLFWARDVTGVAGRVLPKSVASLVPTSGWRIYTIGDSMPDIKPAAFKLKIDGFVTKPLTYTLDDLKALPRVEQTSDFQCVTGWSVKNVRWAGVRFKDLLAEAGLKPTASYLRFISDEVPYDDTLTLDQAFLGDVLLAYEQDGAPLTRPHGAPVRVVMPQMYGYKSVKWVTRIEALETQQYGFWEQHGYDTDAWIGKSNGDGA
jgi:DMSO/TMAO reductase YedYZ molybdopterin-dependent catalytic subunit